MIYDARDTAPLRIGVFLASAAAWAATFALPEGASCHFPTQAGGASFSQVLASQSLFTVSSGWLLMLVAMMAPMTLPALYHIRLNSFKSRRLPLSALFLMGYTLVWMAAGVVMKGGELMAKWLAPGSYLPAIAVGLIAFVWQASPLKQRCLNRCHSHNPLSAFGVEAHRDALLMGLDHGRFCVGSCWAIMLFPMLLPKGHLVAMAAVTVLMFSERLDPPARLMWRLRGFGTAWAVLRMWLFGPGVSPPPYAR